MFLPKTGMDWVEWLGAISGIGGAVIIALNIGIVGYGYLVFSVSTICYLYVGWKLKRMPLLIMNIIFAGINILGIWRWLL